MQFYYNFNSTFQPCDICKWHKSSVHSLLLIFSALCFLLRGYEQKLQKLNTKQKIQHSSPNSRAQIIREYQTSIWFTALSFNSNNFCKVHRQDKRFRYCIIHGCWLDCEGIPSKQGLIPAQWDIKKQLCLWLLRNEFLESRKSTQTPSEFDTLKYLVTAHIHSRSKLCYESVSEKLPSLRSDKLIRY